jgi:hypothetical protein
MTIDQQQILAIIKAALWGVKPDASLFQDVDWKAIDDLAKVETVRGLLIDGISRLSKEFMPNEDIVMDFVGQQRKIEIQNEAHRETIVQIDKILREKEITAVFMKGQMTALRYPNPLRRQPGDIDFVVDKKDFSSTLDALETIGKVDRQLIHEHHGMAWVNGITVEPHYKVHNYQRPSTDKAMQEMFKEIFPYHRAQADIDGYQVNIFPPTFESVFLISHMVNHVYEEGLGLRQVIDYATFLNKCADKINWVKHDEYLDQMRTQRAFRIFTCICVEYLGLTPPSQVEPFSYQEKEWAKKMIEDIFEVGNFGRGKYVFKHDGISDAFRNYCWVFSRCLRLGFVCPSEARWWVVSKFTRFLWKLNLKKHNGSNQN